LQSFLGKQVATIVFGVGAYLGGKSVAAPAREKPAGEKIDDILNLSLSI
jgi:hypothetical protein